MLNIRVNLEFGSKNAKAVKTREAPHIKSAISSRPSTAVVPKALKSTRTFESKSFDFDREPSIEENDPALEVAKLEEFSANFNAPPIKEFMPHLRRPGTARIMLRSTKQPNQGLLGSRKPGVYGEEQPNKSNPKANKENKLSPYFDLFASGDNIAQKDSIKPQGQPSLHPEPKKIDLRSNLIPTNVTEQLPLFRLLDDTRGLSGVKRFGQKVAGELKKEPFYQPWTTQAMLLSASSEDSVSTTTSPRRITLAQAFALKNKRKKAGESITKPNKRTLDDRMIEDELTMQIKETSERIEMFHTLNVQKKVAVNDFCREYSRDLSKFDVRGKSVSKVLMEKTALKARSQDEDKHESQKFNQFTMYSDEQTEQMARAKTPWVDKEEVKSLKKHFKILSNQKECLVQVKRKVLAQALKNYGKEINRMPVKDILFSSQFATEEQSLYEVKEQQLFGMQTQAVVSQHQADSLLKPGFVQVQNRIFSLEFVVLELLRCGQIISANDFSCELPTKIVDYLLEVSRIGSKLAHDIQLPEAGQKQQDQLSLKDRTESASKRPKSVTFSKTLSTTGWHSRTVSATYSVKSAIPSASYKSMIERTKFGSRPSVLGSIIPMNCIPDPLMVWCRRVTGLSKLSASQVNLIKEAATRLHNLKNEFVNTILQDSRLAHYKEQALELLLCVLSQDRACTLLTTATRLVD